MAIRPLSEDFLDGLGEEFAQRLRRGESPSINEYMAAYPPEQAKEIEEFLQSVGMLEDLKRGETGVANSAHCMPEVFGRYRILQTLGEGGMGAVYLAHDSQLNRKVALKTPKFDKYPNARLVERFYREARSAATLQHPNICSIYDVGELEGVHYISMAYIEGRPLSDYIKSHRRPPVSAAVRVVRKVALALQEAHAQGVVHRDLKPANIIIDRHHEPIVMDFGLAREFELRDGQALDVPARADSQRSQTTKVEPRLTQDGAFIGSPGYMSPEQIRGQHSRVGPASDVYSLGVLLFELLIGELPFKGDGSLSSILSEVIESDPPDAAELRHDLEPEVSAICRKAMAKAIEDRYESMQAFAAALTSFLKSEPDPPASSAIPEVKNPHASIELVRAREQCELVHSLYQEGQYAAALSILEKMVGDKDTNPNKFTEWAKSELPKVRARVQKPSNRNIASTSQREEDFWNQDLTATAIPSSRPTSAAFHERSVRRGETSRRLHAFIAIPVVAIGLLLAAVISIVSSDGDADQKGERGQAKEALQAPSTNRGSQRQEPDTKASTANMEAQESDLNGTVDRVEAANNASPRKGGERPTLFGNFGQIPVARLLLQFDADRDDKLSEKELARIPRGTVARRLTEDFADFDRIPRDGFLDERELRWAIKEVLRSTGRANRNPGRRP